MSGWITLHRKFLDWEWYGDQNTSRLFIHLLLTANHKDQKWRGVEIRRGQVLTGRSALAVTSGLSVQTVRTSLQRLQSTNEITIKKTNKYSIITITNWEKYQGNNQQGNHQSTINQPSTNHQLTTNNNVNNEKKYSSSSRDDAAKTYAFEGRVIRLTEDDYRKWKTQFYKIEHFKSELEAADIYYSETPPKDGKWFFPVFNWLRKAHNKIVSEEDEFQREQEEIYKGVII
jgi:hypothetical protein